MDDIEYIISDISTDHDFTIIYKGKKRSGNDESECLCEIKTSKNELENKLRYFKQKSGEFHHLDEIYIHDKFHTDVFLDFINSITTKRIKINQMNCYELLEISKKYEYNEIREKVQDFIQKRPDIKSVIDDLLSPKEDNKNANKNHQNDDFDTMPNNSDKEEIISNNLDVCLQNGYLERIPFPILIRILNSPQRVLHNHQLLFNFVIQKLNKSDKNEKSDIQILPSCLDYTRMSNEEILELINNQNYSEIFKPQKESEMTKSVLLKLNEINNKNSSYDVKISELYKKISDIKQSEEHNVCYLKELNEKIKDIQEKYEQQSIFIQKQEKMIQNLQNLNEKNEQKIKDIQEKYEQQSNLIQKQDKMIQNLQNLNEKFEKLTQEKLSRKEDESKEFHKISKLAVDIQCSSQYHGIFNYLQTHSNIKNEVKIAYSSNGANNDVYCILEIDKIGFFQSNNQPDPWVCFEFTNHTIVPSSYSIRSANRFKNYYHPKSWVIEGSNDNSNWANLDIQVNCSYLNEPNHVHTFSIRNQDKRKFKFIKMRLTDKSWCSCLDNSRLVFSSIEFYGKLI